MADFSAADLLDAANTLYGQDVLRKRMRGGATDADKDLLLLQVAYTVIGRVEAAAFVSSGWPLPGVWPAGSKDYRDGTSDIGGFAYSVVWPADLYYHALGLFNWRTMDGLDGISSDKTKAGLSHEQYFKDLEMEKISLALGTESDIGQPVTIMARDRMGNDLVGDGSVNQPNVLDAFSGGAWDRFL